LLRHGISYPGKTKWSKAHHNWLTAMKMPHPAQQIAFTEYLDALANSEARISRINSKSYRFAKPGVCDRLSKPCNP
jgi:transposase